jgi:hypothetical protein
MHVLPDFSPRPQGEKLQGLGKTNRVLQEARFTLAIVYGTKV